MTTTQSISEYLKPIGDRLLFKNGAANVSKEHIDRQTSRFFKDIFTSLIDLRWLWTILIFCSFFIVSWTFFACLWFSLQYASGDIAWYDKWLNAEDQDEFERENPRTPCVRHLYTFVSAFLYSIETQHTIGFGFRHVTEQCAGGPILLVTQSITGFLILALLTGVIIAKLARPQKRAQNVIFSKNAVICYRDEVLCLVFRIGDLKKSHIIQTKITARLIKKHMTKEGELLAFHQQDLKLSADGCNDQVMLMWPTFVVHQIDSKSPLYEMSASDIQREQFEIIVMLDGGVESTGLQTQIRSSYLPSEILWGHRFQSTISLKQNDSEYEVDYDLFHRTYKVDTPVVSAKVLNEIRNTHEQRTSIGITHGISNGRTNGIMNGIANGITNGVTNGITNRNGSQYFSKHDQL